MDNVFQVRRRMVFAFSGVWAGVFLLTTAIATPLEAADAKVTYASSQELRAMLIKRGRFHYPWAARRDRRSGRGIFRVYVNPDGKVRTVGVVQSTRHQDLDLAAAAGLYHSLFKPGRRREIDLPVTFTLTRVR